MNERFKTKRKRNEGEGEEKKNFGGKKRKYFFKLSSGAFSAVDDVIVCIDIVW